MTRILRWTCTNVRFSGFPSLHQNRQKMLPSLLRAHPQSLLHLNPYLIYSLTHSLAVPLNLSPVVPLQLGSSWTWTWTWTRKIKIVANLGHNLCELVLTLSKKSVVESWKLYERTSAFKLISKGLERYKKKLGGSASDARLWITESISVENWSDRFHFRSFVKVYAKIYFAFREKNVRNFTKFKTVIYHDIFATFLFWHF